MPTRNWCCGCRFRETNRVAPSATAEARATISRTDRPTTGCKRTRFLQNQTAHHNCLAHTRTHAHTHTRLFDRNFRKRRCRPIGYLVLEELFFSLRESESRGILSAARETERNPENGNRVLPRRGRESFERRQRRRFIGSRRFRRRTGAERRGFVVRDSIGAQHGRYNRDNEIYQRRHRPCRDSCRNPPEPKQQADGLRTNPSRSNLGL